ncbi:MAG: two-component sensor histidine kinase [Bacteroidetes bacterium]|nr:two-component sensor histidine kinase [Bacteroidota bacterium]
MNCYRFQIFFLIILLSVTHSQSQVTKLSKSEISNITNDATLLMRNEKYEKSLIKSRIALQHAIATEDDNLIAKAYNIIGANFDELSEYDKAFYYYKKGLVFAERTTNHQLKNWLYNNLGNIYCFDKKEYETGIKYYQKSLEYSSKIRDSTEIVFTKLNITWAYFDIGKFDKGAPYLEFINKYHPKFGDNSTIVVLNMLNGMYNNNKNNNDKTNYYFENAIKLGKQYDEKSDLSYSHLEYSKFLFKVGEHKKAYQNLEAYNILNEELNYESKQKKVNVAGINLQIDEYKREIDNIETKYKSKEQLLVETQSKNKRVSILIISALLLIIILLYFYFEITSLKQKNNIKNIQSKIQQNIINASIDGQEMERKKIASFLHDNISALLSSAGLHLNVYSSINKIESEEIAKTKAILNDAHEKVRDLSHQLIPSLLVRFGLFYALNDLCEKNSNATILFGYESTVDAKTRYQEEFEMKIYFTIAELLNNIMKHSYANLGSLYLTENNGELSVTVTDNGIGFNAKDIHAVEGFGLNRTKARIMRFKGQFIVKSAPNEGTTVTIITPIRYKNN